MPDWAVILLGLAGAVIGLLLVIVGYFVSDKLESIKTSTASLHTKVDAALRGLADCVTWEEFNKLKADVTCHSTEIAIIKTTYSGRHGN